jgi:hypothetical protein
LGVVPRHRPDAGDARPGYTSGDAIAEMERLAGMLPRGFGYEWTGAVAAGKTVGGMIVVVVLALLTVPVFFVSVMRFFSPDKAAEDAAAAEPHGPPAPIRSAE